MSAGTGVRRLTFKGKVHLSHFVAWPGWRSATGCGIAGDSQQVGSLVVQMKGMQRGDEGAPLTVGDCDRFVPDGSGQGAR